MILNSIANGMRTLHPIPNQFQAYNNDLTRMGMIPSAPHIIATMPRPLLLSLAGVGGTTSIPER